ncbi:MAG: ABC transporter substrate-binding protein [Dehalococcoidia bacterium]
MPVYTNAKTPRVVTGGKQTRFIGLIVGIILLLSLPLLLTCSNGDSTATDNDSNPPETNGEVTITIGNLTDQTGVAAEAMYYVGLALNDIAEYYNQNNLIPGVKLKVIDYDEQYDASKDIPGYLKLKQDGADLIWTPVPQAVPVLKPYADRDKYVVFTASANMEESELNGGYVFSLGITPENEGYSFLSWLAENDEDFPIDRPARIGAAAWDDGYSNLLYGAAEEYARAHPEQFEWDQTFLTNFNFDWTTQAEELKDCDYVFIPTPPQIFMEDFRSAGGTAKFIGTDLPLAFLRFFDKADLWEQADGSLFIRSSRWYNETGEMIDVTNQLLEEKYFAEKAEDILSQGCTYIGTKHAYLMLDIVRQAVEEAGAENFDSAALYDAAISWSYEYENIPDFASFDEEKRISQNYYAIYEARASGKDIYRVHDEWLPFVDSP